MPLRLHFTQMNEACRRMTQARWFDAHNGDGYCYDIGRAGHPIGRKRATDKNTWPRTALAGSETDGSSVRLTSVMPSQPTNLFELIEATVEETPGTRT